MPVVRKPSKRKNTPKVTEFIGAQYNEHNYVDFNVTYDNTFWWKRHFATHKFMLKHNVIMVR